MKDSECVAFLQWALPRLGLRWPGFRKVRGQVCKRVARRLAALGLPGPAAYRALLDSRPEEWPVLDALCRVTISTFYRDRAVFEALEHSVLPGVAAQALARGETRLRTWSAGCASGEEPYTLALVWRFAVAAQFPALAFEVLGTDADADLLRRAVRACYPPSSVKSLPAAWLNEAFETDDDAFCLRPEYREGVAFRRHDLREPPPPGPFDLVLCRNVVLTYFTEALQQVFLARLKAVLAPGALLVLGSHERLPEGTVGYRRWAPHLPVFVASGSDVSPVTP